MWKNVDSFVGLNGELMNHRRARGSDDKCMAMVQWSLSMAKGAAKSENSDKPQDFQMSLRNSNVPVDEPLRGES